MVMFTGGGDGTLGTPRGTAALDRAGGRRAGGDRCRRRCTASASSARCPTAASRTRTASRRGPTPRSPRRSGRPRPTSWCCTQTDDGATGRRPGRRAGGHRAPSRRCRTPTWSRRRPRGTAAAGRWSPTTARRRWSPITLAGADDDAKAEAYERIADRPRRPRADRRRSAGRSRCSATWATRSTADIARAESLTMPIVVLLCLVVFGSIVSPIAARAGRRHRDHRLVRAAARLHHGHRRVDLRDQRHHPARARAGDRLRAVRGQPVPRGAGAPAGRPPTRSPRRWPPPAARCCSPG